MALDQTAHQGESDPEAGFRAVCRTICAKKKIEHLRQDTGFDTYATVANADNRFARPPFDKLDFKRLLKAADLHR